MKGGVQEQNCATMCDGFIACTLYLHLLVENGGSTTSFSGFMEVKATRLYCDSARKCIV